jgi:hypothetical protein
MSLQKSAEIGKVTLDYIRKDEPQRRKDAEKSQDKTQETSLIPVSKLCVSASLR